MNRQPIKAAPALYASLLPDIVAIAKECGYAIGLHGSMSHDLDLIAVPWQFNAFAGKELVKRIADHVGGFIDFEGATVKSPSPETKVHGRVGWCIYFNKRFIGPYIDISVTPRIDYETKKVIEDPAMAHQPGTSPESPDNPGTLATSLITNIESPLPSTTKTKGTGEESST